MSDGYNKNSRPQLVSVDSTLPYIREAIDVLDIRSASSPWLIADFGAAHGRNSIYAMKMIIQSLKETKRIAEESEVLVVHNDLPSNDWSQLFDLLNAEKSYFGVANGRSFYQPCLPKNSLSVGYSSTSLHWLSRKPCNLSNHCASLFAQGDELKAFREQARRDWTDFVEHRSHELIAGGVLILLIPAVDERGSNGFDLLRELLYRCAQSLLTPAELLDYTFPIHARSYAECLDAQLFARCSLQVVRADFASVPMPFIKQAQDEHEDIARSMASYVRSWSELTLKQALVDNHRAEQQIEPLLQQFWALYEQEARKEVSQLLDTRMNFIYLILQKKHWRIDGGERSFHPAAVRRF